MTSVEIISYILQLIKDNQFTGKDIETLEQKLQKIDQLDGFLFENTVLPRLGSTLFEIQINNNEELALNVIKCITITSKKSRLKNVHGFEMVIKLLLYKICDREKSLIYNVSEQIKISILNCIETLSRRITGNVIEEFYINKNRLDIAQLIHVCLECSKDKEDIEVKCAAISCLMGVLQIHDDFEKDDLVLRDQISSVIFIMTPKIFADLINIVESDSRTPRRLRAKAVQAFGRMLCLIFEDVNQKTSNEITASDFKALLDTGTASISDSVETSASLTSTPKNAEDKMKFLETAKKSNVWLQTALKKLQPFIQRLPALLLNDFGNFVHKELAILCADLIYKCSKIMRPCLPTLCEIILLLSSSDDPSISTECLSCISQMSIENPLIFQENLQTGWEIHLRRLSRIIHRLDEQQLVIALRLLNAYLGYFVENNPFFITRSDNLEMLFNNLILLFEIQYPIYVTDEVLEWNTMDFEVDLYKKRWRYLKYVQDNLDLDRLMSQICGKLMHDSIRTIVVNVVFDKIALDQNISNELMCLLLRMMNAESCTILVKSVIEEFLLEKHWYLDTKFTTASLDIESKMNREELQFNVIHICLVIEIVSSCSGHISEDMEQYLFNVLPKLLEMAGGTNKLIHSAALYGLYLVSNSFNYKSIQSLISSNADFLSHYIGVRIRRDDLKNSLDMTNAFLQLHSSYDDFVFIQSLMRCVTELLSKRISDQSIACCLKILLILVRKVKSWKNSKNNETIVKPTIVDCKALYDEWHEILYPQEVPEFKDEDTKFDFEQMQEEMLKLQTEDNEENPFNRDDKDESDQNKFLRELIRSCLGYMSSSDVTHKMFSLDLVMLSLESLDQNLQFLPTVDLIWGSLSMRFQEKNLLVVSRNFDLLLVMSKLAKDFIQKRTSSKVLPYIIEILKAAQKENLENTGTFASSQTQSFKLQQKIFLNIGEIFQILDFNEKDLDDLLNVCLLYWTTNQPREIKKSCLDLLRKLYQYDPTAVIVKLQNVEGFV